MGHDQQVVLERLTEILANSKSKYNTQTDHTIDSVSAELTTRAEFGLKKYGTYLKTWNGRSAAQDLREELLDALMYNEQMIMENASMGDSKSTAAELYGISIRVNLVNMLSMLEAVVRMRAGGDHVPAPSEAQTSPANPGQP